MRKLITKNVLIFVVLFILFLGSLAGGCVRDEIFGARPFVLAFFENGWGSPLHGSSMPSLRENEEKIDIVSPFWFTVKMDGSIEDNHNQEAMDFSRDNNIPVIALFNNEKDVIPGNDGMLQNSDAWDKSIAEIIEIVDEYDYDGINIDFEIMPPESRDLFTEYVRELTEALNPKGKEVDVSVFPRVGVAEDMHHVYDFSALGEICDRFVLMTYNEHYPASDPGPIASTGWVKDNIEDALREVPLEKLVLGIAVYGYDWPGAQGGSPETVEYIPMTEAKERAGRNDVEIEWDEELQSPFYKYYEDGTEREVWFENAESISHKLDLVKEFNLPGIAIWRIGFEDESVWEALN